MEMPKLRPLAIKTQKRTLFSKLWRLIFNRRQWQVIEDWHYILPNNRQIIIPKGFVFDGSSYPAIIWFLFSPTGLLLIPVMLHDFCFRYNYFWATHNNKIYKLKIGNGFFRWSALIRDVGIARNELFIIDYALWLICISFGWINWLAFQKKDKKELKPEGFDN